MDHRTLEAKWRKLWREKGVYKVDLNHPKKKFYNLMMFPYPSAEGLHVGNMYAFTGADIYGRFQAMQGFDVFEPIGLDGFGIHSENFAIKINKHPVDQAKVSQKRFYDQLERIGNRFSWDNRLETYDPDYYKWTQWLFIQMFKHGLAYRKKASVNWCPSCKTVLADEQVIDGRCERCGTVVEKRETEQWFFKITAYADRLLDNIKKIDWPQKIKIAQEQWIGKSKGLSIDFKVAGLKRPITVWTKFWETVFGTTYLVLAPEHWAVEHLQGETLKVKEYVKSAKNKSDQERLAGAGNKTGVFTGVYATNPVNNEKVPVWIADYVLKDVGTGAVMGVPAHDERDFAFARKYKLGIRKVVDVLGETHSLVMKESVKDGFTTEIEKQGWYWMDYEGWGIGVVFPKGEEKKYIELVQKYLKKNYWFVHTDGVLKAVIFKDKVFDIIKENETAKKYALSLKVPKTDMNWDALDDYMFCHEKGGKLVNSGQFDGLDAWTDGKTKMADWMIAKNFARWETNYHLRDWLISRQRYWGPPIPMIFCEKCGWQPEKEENLPVKLPYLKNFKPTDDGKPPLERAEKDWLYTKCPKCGGQAKRETEVSDTFLDSSWYFLRYPSVEDHKNPFDKDITAAWLPVDAYIGGAEHAVLHLLYSRFVWMALQDWGYLPKKLGDEPFPFLYGHGLIIKGGAKMSKSKGNIVNPDEYMDRYGTDALRLYLMFIGPYNQGGDFSDTGMRGMNRFLARVEKLVLSHPRGVKDMEVTKLQHQIIKRVTEAMKHLRYNVAIAALMEYVNGLEKLGADKESLRVLILMLAPFAPYICEELWQKLGGKFSVHQQSWPSFKEALTKNERVTFIVQVNGKIRKKLNVSAVDSRNQTKMTELAKKATKQMKPIKSIFVPGRLVNLVVR